MLRRAELHLGFEIYSIWLCQLSTGQVLEKLWTHMLEILSAEDFKWAPYQAWMVLSNSIKLHQQEL